MSDNETQSQLFEAVGQYLQEAELNFDVLDESGYIGMYDGEHMTWRVIIQIDPDPETRRIRVSSILPIKAPVQIRSAMSELLTRMNDNTGIGGWNMNMDSGAMHYGVGIDLMDGVLSKSMFERMMGVNMDVVDVYAPTINSVMYGGVSPSDAYRAYVEQRQQEEILH